MSNKNYIKLAKKSAAKQISELKKNVTLQLLPKEKFADRNVILEVRAGTGGDEASLFAVELFRMYQRYSENRGWKFEYLSINDNGIGGYKEAIASISSIFLPLSLIAFWTIQSIFSM